MFLKKINIAPILVLLLLFSVPAFAQHNGDIKKSTKTEVVEGKKYYLHTVEKGQTLYAIAKAYGLTVNDILLENPDALNGIKPGEILKIPFEKPPVKLTAADTTYFIHVVEAGQTLYKIELLYHVTEAQILALNPDAERVLQVGDKLKIPGKKPVTNIFSPSEDSVASIHKVEAGETIYSISKLYSVSQNGILKLNPEVKNGLKIGQEIKIPTKNYDVAAAGIYPQNSDTLYVGHKKAIYNVALMLPLQLWNVDNIDPDQKDKPAFPPKVEAAVSFYEGVLIAVDSMRRAGMKVNLHVYDVDDGDSTKVMAILNKPEFPSMDLILGPLSPGPFYTVSNWAKEHHIAIVSPVSPANKVLFKHPEAAKALPSLSTQMEQLATYVGEHHKSDNVIMITSGNVKEQAAATTFRVNVSKLLFPAGGDTIKTTRGMSGLEAMLKKDKANILVIPSGSQTFVSDLLRSLNTLSDKYVIVVYGLSSWMGFDNLDPEYLQKLQFHFVAPYFIDYDSSATVQNFMHKYYTYFKGDPNQYAFAGYDVGLFFLQALNDYGTDFFEKLPDIKGEGVQQKFNFYRSDAESGYENRGVTIVEVADYKLVKVE
jgi:LysM repeat protein/ABC-type branched-subunit amino acid transport system substrate-binding protein